MSAPTSEHTRWAQVQKHIPVKIVWKADSTFEASSADVSMNDSPFSTNIFGQHLGSKRKMKACVPENAFASSVGTALKCFKSLLFPTSMITMFESA